MEIRLQQCLKNKKQRGKGNNKQKNINGTEDCNDVDVCEEELQSQIAKSGNAKGKTAAVKKYLRISRKQRQIDVRTLPASEMLHKYPVLQETQFLLWEFGEIVEMPVRTMRKNLQTAIPKLISIITDENNETKIELFFLKKIDSLFKNDKKRGRENRKLVLIIEDNNDKDDEVPKTDRAPYLIIQGDCDKNVKCFVDAEPLFIEAPLDAILLLLATYWVFDIHFDKHFKNQLTLLSVITFGEDAEKILGPHGIESISVNNIITKAGL
ncbi:uncharacterized protein LOC122503222 isoform X2 [Leptopilina heterotoma]|nr:uncharacterized protein LOC122503222 isoform X2 [Leptopilina heterotoma]XP_043469621.1 uncharacterized protein LOC122503222 isoform X2 [Leptopilina heterotoma]XP_043469623.1 uncharacterized protein LOC122503222 isoform X2 [Leptopilina heterotoma]